MVEAGLRLQFEKTVLSSLTGLSESVHKQLYADYGYLTDYLNRFINADEVKMEIRTFDEKVVSVFRKLGFARNGFEYILEGLRDIPEARCVDANHHPLPLENPPPARVTLLDRLAQFWKTRTTAKGSK